MTKRHVRTSILALTFTTASVTLLAAACGDDETTNPPAAAPDGATPPSDDAGGNAEPQADSGGEEEGELITSDGGVDPPAEEEDGGVSVLDAGPACENLSPGEFTNSECVSTPIRIGLPEAFSNSRWVLRQVIVLGTPDACGPGGGFEPREHRGALRITATSSTTAKFELIDEFRRDSTSLRLTTRRYDVDVTATGNRLKFEPLECSLTPPPSEALFFVSTENGRKVLTLRLPWGATSQALYRFALQE